MRLKLVAVAIAALAPVVAMLAYNQAALRHQRNEEVRAQATQSARLASAEVERIVEGLHALLVSVASMPSIRNLDVAECNEALKSVSANVANIRTIFVIDLKGKPICGSFQATADMNFADRDYFKAALETGNFVVGTYTISRISDAPVLPMAIPLMIDGKPLAVVATGVRLDWLQNRITERGIAPGNAVTIADHKGTILARVPQPERFVGTVIPDAYQSLVNADEPGVIDIVSQDGTERILGYRPVALPASPLYVSAGFSKDEAFAPIKRSTLMNTLAIAGGALFAFLAAVLIGNRFLLQPIARIADVLEKWQAGETAVRTGMKGTDELAAVGAALDRLLDELEERRRRNERAEEERTLLVRELAHRVKNGFALVQAIARQTFFRVQPDRYQSFAERLSALAGTYDLLLSREAPVSAISDIISATLRAHAGTDRDHIRLEGPQILLPAELALPLSLVIHELATNATKYGSLLNDAGTVSIDWKSDGHRVLLAWTEAGGPPVSSPARRGFGSVLIERAFPAKAQARSKPDFRREGLRFELAFSVD